MKPDDLCIGCRIATGAPPAVSDQFPVGRPPHGMGWQSFLCARCGLSDVRLNEVVQ